MTTSIAILVMENAFLSWLFNYAPITAITLVFGWFALRIGTSYGRYETQFINYEARFQHIESDIKDLKKAVAAIDVRLARVEARLDGLEHHMTVIIDLLKNKKSI